MSGVKEETKDQEAGVGVVTRSRKRRMGEISGVKTNGKEVC